MVIGLAGAFGVFVAGVISGVELSILIALLYIVVVTGLLALWRAAGARRGWKW
jgi:hypothetical protein